MTDYNIDKDNIDIDVSTDLQDDKQDESQDDKQDQATTDQVENYLPLLALRDVVVYPHMQIALFVGRAPSVKAVELAQAEYGNKVLVVAQKDSLTEDIDQDNLYQYGTVCRIVSTMPHDSDEDCIKVLIEGQYRVRVDSIEEQDDILMATFEQADVDIEMDDSQQKNTIKALTRWFCDVLKFKQQRRPYLLYEE